MKTNGSVIVSWDFTNGKDTGVVIVGTMDSKNKINIINAFQGEEAEEVYNKLFSKGNLVTGHDCQRCKNLGEKNKGYKCEYYSRPLFQKDGNELVPCKLCKTDNYKNYNEKES